MKRIVLVVGVMLMSVQAFASGSQTIKIQIEEMIREEVLRHLKTLSLITTVPGNNKNQCLDAMIRNAVNRHAPAVGDISEVSIKGSKLNILSSATHTGRLKDELSDIVDDLFGYKYKLKASTGKYEGDLTVNFLYHKTDNYITCYADIAQCVAVPVFELRHKRETLVSIKPLEIPGQCDGDDADDDLEDLFD